jgi:signal peptidase I
MTSQEQNLKSSSVNFWQSIKENGKIVAIALVLAFLIRIFIAEPRYIPSDSMYPTLTQGDRLVIEKVSYYFHPPHRGDIVVFQPPVQLQMLGYDKSQAFIKRVIGTSGETLEVNEGKVYLNHQPLTEKYIAQMPNYHLDEIVIPDHYLFVMGDNRNNSNDSHIWGFLPEENVIGKATFRFFPFNHFEKL